MIRIVITIIFCLFFFTCFSQKYYTDIGEIKFDGSKAAFEPIKATNNNAISIIDLKTGQIAAIININQFEFRLSLMQEHFNENYLESNNYPTSTFEGKFKKFNSDDLNENYKEYEITGNITIKDVIKKINTIVHIRKMKNQIQIKSDFSIILSDYGIGIPKIVFKKIDEEVKINLNFLYDKKD